MSDLSDELINIHPNTPPIAGYRNLTIKAKGNEIGQLSPGRPDSEAHPQTG